MPGACYQPRVGISSPRRGSTRRQPLAPFAERQGALEALGGANRITVVTGPLGDPVEAAWRFHRGTAVIEMARASGLTLVGGAAGNDAMAATTTGTGELIDQALQLGAKKIVVCLGGSATTDGGLGCVRAITAPSRLKSVQLLVACDVQTLFTDAAPVFAPQKGATPAQVDMLRGRLERLAQMYEAEYGVDVRSVPGTGAAGGLAGGLVALGGTLLPGFDLVADEVDLHDHIAAADLVITGEGYLGGVGPRRRPRIRRGGRRVSEAGEPRVHPDVEWRLHRLPAGLGGSGGQVGEQIDQDGDCLDIVKFR